jgi:hypothetical protein
MPNTPCILLDIVDGKEKLIVLPILKNEEVDWAAKGTWTLQPKV